MSDHGWFSDLGWYGRTWYDRRQNEQLEGLAGQLSQQRSELWHERRETRKLTAQLSKVQGGMEQRLTRLATAFDAFVELSDLREELRAFQPAVTARHHARRVLGQLLTSGSPAELITPPPTEIADDVPGYWLPRAVAGLVATLQRDQAAAEAVLTEARGVDSTRTDLFLCTGLALTEQLAAAAEHLPTLLDLAPDQAVTHAQRIVWLAGVEGRFGDAGQQVIGQVLHSLVTGLPDGTRATQLVAWRGLVDEIVGSPRVAADFPKTATAPPAMLVPLVAAGRLAKLADWYQGLIAASTEQAPPASSDADPPDPILLLLQELVDEGSPEEQPLLNRMAELRQTVHSVDQTPPTRHRWQASLDTPLALVAADVRSGGKSPGRRAVAARAAAPLLAAVADDLVAEASRPVPDEVELRIRRHVVLYLPDGPKPTSVATIEDTIVSAPLLRERNTVQIGWGLVAAAAVVVVAGLLTAPVPALLLAATLAAVGCFVLVEAASTRASLRREEQHRTSDWQRIEREIAKVDTALRALRAQAVRASTEATEARARLDQLAAAPTPA